MPYPNNPLDFPLEFDDEGQPEDARFIPGSLHWVYHQRLLLEHNVDRLEAVAQVTASHSDEDVPNIATLRATAIAADVARGIRELQIIETFMAQSGYWDYELDGYDGYVEVLS